jgi:hypothetical protein
MRKDEIRSVIDSMVYWTECSIATFEMLMSRKTASQSDRRRAGNIARGMVEHVKQFGCAPAGSLDSAEEAFKQELKHLEERLAAAEKVVP